MQTQQYSVPLHSDFYHTMHGMHFNPPDQYLATSGGDFFAGSFSGRSSLTYPHQDYRYFLDRGGPSRLSSTRLTSTINLDATGLGFAGNPSCANNFHTEDIADYEQRWHWPSDPQQELPGQIIPYAVPHDPDSAFLLDKSTFCHEPVVRTPAAQLPTPAAMAVLLNPSVRSDVHPSRLPYAAPLPPPDLTPIVPGSHAPATYTAETAGEIALPSHTLDLSREKKHACTMCHKRFDRPSTLRKHLLVHTGEKAFVCDTCGRRFGVASNLNRHVRRCILKPVNSTLANKPPSGSPAGASPDIGDTSSEMSGSAEVEQGRKRLRGPLEMSDTLPAQSAPAQNQLSIQKQPVQKRRRRAPSPSHWIPASLSLFNFISEDSFKAAPLPLPPVRPNLPREERDSWNENVSTVPYHPSGWKGILPGPASGLGLGLGGKDMRNIDMSGSGGFMLGRVLVF